MVETKDNPKTMSPVANQCYTFENRYEEISFANAQSIPTYKLYQQEVYAMENYS